MAKKKPRAVAYYRVSSEKQRESQSIDLQKLKLAQFAREKGYKITEEYQDDGISGESIEKRPGFQQCLDHIAQGDTDVLLVFMVDRIGRFKERRDRNRVIELLEESKTSVDSPYDKYFDHKSETDLNDLEGLLNESRRDNVRRGIRVAEGHTSKRLAGGFSGGRLPYGVAYDKETKEFSLVPEEVRALKQIFDKTNAGWGIRAVRDYLNAKLARYPKRVHTYRGKTTRVWTVSNIRHILSSDFYFTGVIEPSKKSKAKGVPSVDTGLKIIPKETVDQARRELSTRRWRCTDPNRLNRKRTHAQEGTVFFTDALVHGLARCGHCGRKLGLHHIRKESGNTYTYYKCNGKWEHDCPCPQISARKLDPKVWRLFVESFTDPERMQEMILKGEFMVDKDRAYQRDLLDKARAELDKLHGMLNRMKELYKWGDSTAKDYKQDRARAQKLIDQKEQEIARLEENLQRPEEVEEAVNAATSYVHEQVGIMTDALALLGELDKLRADLEGDTHSPNETLDRVLKDLEVRSKRRGFANLRGFFAEARGILERLGARTASDLPATEAVRDLVYKQKRAMLQKFVDFEEGRGIRFWNQNRIEIYFSIDSF